MGILIEDAIHLPTGITLTGCYGSIGNSEITVQRVEPGLFKVNAVGSIWLNSSSRRNKKKATKCVALEIDINQAQLQTNIYDTVYTYWKALYTDVRDEI